MIEPQFSDKFLAEADQNVTLKRIRKATMHRLLETFPNKTQDELELVCEKILQINGLDLSHFNFVKQVERVISEKLNDVSIDDNSNKNEKTIAGIFNEIANPIKKAVGFDYLYRTMKEMYGKKEAKRLTSLMYDYSIGLSDSSNIMIPYCLALDASKLVTEGRQFGQLKSMPAKRVSSYISALCETVHQLSSHFAGAIAVGTYFFDIAHILLVKQKIDPKTWFNEKHCKRLENEFQQFVHSVNHLSRSGAESPFTNLSIFDEVKIRYLVKNDLAWYFTEVPDVNDVIETIMKLQTIFLDYFDKGDPLANGMPYRFPVVTLNFSKEVIEGSPKLVDEKFLKEACKRDIYRYNIFTSEGSKVASCCRLLSDSEMLDMASQSNSFGAGAVGNLGSHRVCTINYNRIALQCKGYDDYKAIFERRMEDTKKILMAHKTLIKKLSNAGLQMFIANGWVALSRLFSTYGVMGLYEANLTMEERFGEYNGDFITDILIKLNNYVRQATIEEPGFAFNIEEIPGESYAVRLATVDKLLYGEDAVPYDLYANQWIPLWKEATIWERLEEDGKYNKLLTGGGIVHASIKERVTSEQAEEVIKYAVGCGCEHFALNAVYSRCVKDHTTFGGADICPICGGDIVTKLSRVVGYLAPVENWNPVRRKHDFPNRTFVKL